MTTDCRRVKIMLYGVPKDVLAICVLATVLGQYVLLKYLAFVAGL